MSAHDDQREVDEFFAVVRMTPYSAAELARSLYRWLMLDPLTLEQVLRPTPLRTFRWGRLTIQIERKS